MMANETACDARGRRGGEHNNQRHGPEGGQCLLTCRGGKNPPHTVALSRPNPQGAVGLNLPPPPEKIGPPADYFGWEQSVATPSQVTILEKNDRHASSKKKNSKILSALITAHFVV